VRLAAVLRRTKLLDAPLVCGSGRTSLLAAWLCTLKLWCAFIDAAGNVLTAEYAWVCVFQANMHTSLRCIVDLMVAWLGSWCVVLYSIQERMRGLTLYCSSFVCVGGGGARMANHTCVVGCNGLMGHARVPPSQHHLCVVARLL
jgi:hypothetical protein